MNNSVYQIGQEVIRLGSKKDYTTGREGIVVEIAEERIRVRWLKEKHGGPVSTPGHKPDTGNGVRTWVNKRFLSPINR